MICQACGSRNPRYDAGLRHVRDRDVGRAGDSTRIRAGLLDRRRSRFRSKARAEHWASSPLYSGSLSLTPLTFLAGIPAIILSIVVLSRASARPQMAYTGLVTGTFGTAILTFVDAAADWRPGSASYTELRSWSRTCGPIGPRWMISQP